MVALLFTLWIVRWLPTGGEAEEKETNLRLVRPLSRAMNISSSSRYRLAPGESSKGSIRYRVQDSKVRTGIR